MNASIKIGNAFGIPVRIHLTFLLLVFGASLVSDNALVTLGLVALVFGCVLLHELGHSLVARGFGLSVADITLWPLGGMARMSAIPENPRIEGLIAVAGPAVNFALAGVALLVLLAGHALGLEEGSAADRVLLFFLATNVLQGGFNLLPAFPMDGGRLLRAALARRRDWVSATESAVRVSRFVAGGFLAAALALMTLSPWNACFLPILSLFIWLEGTRELLSVRLRHGFSPFGAALTGEWRTASTETSATRPEEPVEPGAARRPRSWLQRLSRTGGFSEEEIRNMESHPGPLRPPRDPS